jgi:hypothetical protein
VIDFGECIAAHGAHTKGSGFRIQGFQGSGFSLWSTVQDLVARSEARKSAQCTTRPTRCAHERIRRHSMPPPSCHACTMHNAFPVRPQPNKVSNHVQAASHTNARPPAASLSPHPESILVVVVGSCLHAERREAERRDGRTLSPQPETNTAGPKAEVWWGRDWCSAAMIADSRRLHQMCTQSHRSKASKPNATA